MILGISFYNSFDISNCLVSKAENRQKAVGRCQNAVKMQLTVTPMLIKSIILRVLGMILEGGFSLVTFSISRTVQ
jgi:hypothetical protein